MPSPIHEPSKTGAFQPDSIREHALPNRHRITPHLSSDFLCVARWTDCGCTWIEHGREALLSPPRRRRD